MPRVIDYTPSWLSRPSAGFQLFDQATSASSPEKTRQKNSGLRETDHIGENSYEGPLRTIARRGTEIFIVAEKFIRWSDLSTLKSDWEEENQTPTRNPRPNVNETVNRGKEDGPEDGSYRNLQISHAIGEPIRQLSVSPTGKLLAITTKHTVHVAVLPDSNHLGQQPNVAIKLRVYNIGPTTHVLSQSQVASVLWHPFGVSGKCLVTVTTDAVVRLWELKSGDRWSSDTPTLAIDLRKLLVGSSEEEDFSPRWGRNRAFSSDAVGLEVASACFGGNGSSDESTWSAMSLWFAMKGGDLYALSPLIPSRWQPSYTTLSSLSTSVVEKVTFIQDQGLADYEDSRQCKDQYQWIRELDSQDPMIIKGERESSPEIETYSRPSQPGPIPRLQGPFQFVPEDVDEDFEFSDIRIIAAKLDGEEAIHNEESESEPNMLNEDLLSASIICLMTRSGRLYVCLDIEGIEGQWLPRRKPNRLLSPPQDPYLVVIECLDTLQPRELLDLQWPTFSEDVRSRYSLFTTHSKGVFFFSFEPWLDNLERELKGSSSIGTPFRLDIFKNGPGTLREQILSLNQDSRSRSKESVPACLTFDDSDLGYFLMTTADGQPHAATLDKPFSALTLMTDVEDDEEYLLDMKTLAIGPVRSAYEPPRAFWARSSLPNFIDDHVQHRHRKTMRDEIKLSPATLDLMTEAHRKMSQETYLLGVAASDLFRRCQRLQSELCDQIKGAREAANRIEIIIGADADGYLDDIEGKKRTDLNGRIENAREKQEKLVGRHDRLRKRFSQAGGRELSEKERLWANEVHKTREAVRLEEDSLDKEKSALEERFEEVRNLKDELVALSRNISIDGGTTNGDVYEIPQELRKTKVAQVMKLLERESVLVEDAQKKLGHLSL